MTTISREEATSQAKRNVMGSEPLSTADVETGKSLVLVVAVLAVIGAIIALLTAAAQALLGDSAHAITSALHGLVAGLFMISATISLYQGYRLFEGKAATIGEVQISTAVTAMMSLFTIVFGNWIYIAYRASGGPREYFLTASPEIHQIFFEFKEYMALFTLPLAIAAAFIAYYYGRELISNSRMRTVVAVIVALVFFYFLVAFGLGAAITKLKAA